MTPELAGPHHQHLFSFRLDMCLDGPANSVYEVDAVPVPAGPANPYGNAFTVQETLLETESAAQRMAAPERSRSWKIVNHEVRNACGEPVGYTLVPTHASAPLLAQPTAAITSRAAFATRHLWVTPARDDEMRAAGEFPNQHPGGAGLPAWTAADRPVTDTSIALWHTVGVTHFCRPEDFPVMPVEYTGFTLRPAGFFDRNPALDLAPARPRPHPLHSLTPQGGRKRTALPDARAGALPGGGKWRRLEVGGSAIVESGKALMGTAAAAGSQERPGDGASPGAGQRTRSPQSRRKNSTGPGAAASGQRGPRAQ